MTDSDDPIRNLPLVTEPRTTKRAAGWQIALTAFGFVAILTLFFFGINHQRNETAGEQTSATMPTPVAPQGDDAQKGQQQAGQQPEQQQPSTTGQGGGERSNDQNGHASTGEQKTNAQPADGNGQPAQRQSK